MGERERKQGRVGISDRIRSGFEDSWRSLSKIEAEGEKLIRSLAEMGEKYGLDAGTKVVDELGQEARVFLKQLNETVEETTEKVLEGLNIPTKEDLDLYNRRIKTLVDENVKSRLEKLRVPTGRDLDLLAKQLRGNLEDQVKKGMGRLNLATRKDVEVVAKDLKSLRKEVAKLSKAKGSSKTRVGPKKVVSKKKAVSKKKTVSKKKKAARKKATKK
jgi:polyhydroxyalkanoate synthesis regulator phasin